MPRKTKKNTITSKSKTAKICSYNKRLLKDFLEYLASTQKSPGTIAGYQSDLLIFFTYGLEHLDNKPFYQVTKRDLIQYQNWLVNENGNSPARVRRLKAALSSLSNYIEAVLDDEEEYANFRAPIKKIASPVNTPVRAKTILSSSQLQDLLDYLVKREYYEAACMLALGMNSGRRKSELLRFRVDDFKEGNLVCDGALYKTSQPIRTKGRGMGKYLYAYTLAKGFKPYLDLWMQYREERGIESEWLFPHHKDFTRAKDVNTLSYYADKIFTQYLGVDFYWHSLRHYWTTSLLKAGLPERVCQSIQGWASADMVRLYDDTTVDEQLDQYFSGGELNIQPAKQLSEL